MMTAPLKGASSDPFPPPCACRACGQHLRAKMKKRFQAAVHMISAPCPTFRFLLTDVPSHLAKSAFRFSMSFRL